MKEIAISEFKANCSRVLEEVRKTRKPIRVTRFGKPVAEVIPPSHGNATGRRLGSMAGTAEILGGYRRYYQQLGRVGRLSVTLFLDAYILLLSTPRCPLYLFPMIQLP